MTMSRLVVAAATGGGVTVGLLTRAVAPGRALVADRVKPYVQLSRARLGVGEPDVAVLGDGGRARSALEEIVGPILVRAAQMLGHLVDAAGEEAVALRLRQAGYADLSVEQYRQRQLSWTLAGAAGGIGLGLVGRGSAARVLLLGLVAAFWAATRSRASVERSVRQRTARMTTDLYTVCQLLAVHARGHAPIEAVREVVSRGRGPVIDELREALGWIQGGTPPSRAYDRLSDITPEPSAARLYRVLGSAARTGGDIVPALLGLADDVRSTRRDELERSSVRRRALMLIPLLVLIAPVLILFIAAALPHILFGSF